MEIIVDTISFRANFESYENMVDFLGIHGVTFSEGGKFNVNYSRSLYFEGIRIGFDGSAGWNYYVHMSGKGCRTYEDIRGENFTWRTWLGKLLAMIRDNKAAITRLDLANDSFDDTLNLQRIEKYIDAHKYRTRCADTSIRLVKYGEECLYVGSTQSLVLMRIYNKKLERGYNSTDTDFEYWYRCELQFRDIRAEQVLKDLVYDGVGQTFFSYVSDHFDFLAKPNLRDGTQSRINRAGWWSDYLGSVQPVQYISRKGSEYNLSKLQKYALQQAGSSIQTLILSQHLGPYELWGMYTDPSFKLREDQKAFIDKSLEARGDDLYDRIRLH